MGCRQIMFIACLLVSFAGISFSQTSQPPPAKQEDIIKALGTLKLEDLKKAVPSGAVNPIRPESGSHLAKAGAVTRFTEPGGRVAYYFNQAGILVSAQATAKRPLPKEKVLREIKGLNFKKYPPNNLSAAFVRRSPHVVQGFYLDKAEKNVVITTYDFLPR
jgi:YD repeat-containing protein